MLEMTYFLILGSSKWSLTSVISRTKAEQYCRFSADVENKPSWISRSVTEESRREIL